MNKNMADTNVATKVMLYNFTSFVPKSKSEIKNIMTASK